MRLQRGRAQPTLPQGEAVEGVERYPAAAGLAPMEDSEWPQLHAGAHEIPRMTNLAAKIAAAAI